MDYKILLKNKLKNQFGYNDYKNDLQKKISEAIYTGKNDIFIRLPSGFGKSLCYQLPVITKDNSFAIVISPTVAHSKNQTEFLRSKNIEAYYWNSHTPTKIKFSIEKNISCNNPKIKLLYITAECYVTTYFQLILTTIKSHLSYIVIDKAHYISPWSYGCKVSYNNLFKFPYKHPGVPIIAVTAATTEQVTEDIFESLDLNSPLIFSMPVFRSNLFYDVWFIDILLNPLNHLKEFIKKSFGANKALTKKDKNCGIIYCQTADTALNLSQTLNAMGLLTQFYNNKHNTNCFKSQSLWNSEEINVIITTNNVGVHINKQTVRFIVHWDNIPNIQNYYYESGRAGRDGKTSYCRIYCSLNEINNLNQKYDVQKICSSHVPNQRIYLYTKILLYKEMIKYILGLNCRHAVISNYFNDPIPVCKNGCDVCKTKNSTAERLIQLKYCYQFNSSYTKILEYFISNTYENCITQLKPLPIQHQFSGLHTTKENNEVVQHHRHRQYNLSLFNRLQINMNIQLETINEVLYIKRNIKKKTTSNNSDISMFNISEISTIDNNELENDMEVDIVRNSCKISELDGVIEGDIVHNNCEIESLSQNKRLNDRNSSYCTNEKLQIQTINDLLYVKK